MSDKPQNQDTQELSFLQSVAETVIGLVERGHTDPDAVEIADEYFEQPVPASVESEIHDRLPDICEIVRETYDWAHLVSDTYYSAFGETLPQDIETAKRCLPNGRGNPGVGIRIPQVESDMIHLAYRQRNLKCSGGKCEKQVEVLQSAWIRGDITGEDVRTAIKPYLSALESIEDLKQALENSGAIKGPLFESAGGDGAAALPEPASE